MDLAFDKLNGLLPAIVQDAASGAVLMLGYLDQAAVEMTLTTGEAVFFSRSRGRLWRKGETSGHRLRVREVRLDCDGDAVLLRVELLGPGVCHKGYRSCFYRTLGTDGACSVVDPQVFDPAAVYPKGARR